MNKINDNMSEMDDELMAYMDDKFNAENLTEGETHSMRGRAYRRNVRHKTICKKKNIVSAIYDDDYYEHDGQYAKNKIHCSCALCTYGKTYKLPTRYDEKMKEVEKDAIMDAINDGII